MTLECVFQGKLCGAGVADGAGDLTEIAIGYGTVRRPIVRDVEDVEEVGAKIEPLLTPDSKCLCNREIKVLEARPAE